MTLTASDDRGILVIDDNLAIHEDFRKTLVQTRGSSALDHARASPFGKGSVSFYGQGEKRSSRRKPASPGS